jgi:hypothetical protein
LGNPNVPYPFPLLALTGNDRSGFP